MMPIELPFRPSLVVELHSIINNNGDPTTTTTTTTAPRLRDGDEWSQPANVV